jgi:hypothetical protein
MNLQFRRILDLLASLATILVCGYLGWTLFKMNRAQTARVAQTASVGEYHRDERLPALGGFDYAASPQTLMLIVSSTCHFCTQSMPFYKSLVHSHDSATRVVFVGREEEDVLRRYVASNGINDANVQHLSGDNWHIRGTPTAILCDSAGRVKKQWNGKPTSAAETEIRELVAAHARSGA